MHGDAAQQRSDSVRLVNRTVVRLYWVRGDVIQRHSGTSHGGPRCTIDA
eukprot:gene1564-7077_t